MANPEHLEWLEEGVAAWNARIREKLFRADLHEAKLRGADLQGADLREAYLLGTDLRGANLQGALLQAADLTGTMLQRARLREANLHGADLREANLQGADLRNADLKRGALQGTNLREANLRETNLQGARLFRANLFETDLREAHLHGADLSEARLQAADLRKADLQGTNLQGAWLTRATLQSAVLEGTNLDEADLRGAALQNVVLRGANLDGTDLRTLVRSTPSTNDDGGAAYSDLSTALGLTQDQIEEAKGDNGVALPKGLSHPAHWDIIDLPPDHPNYAGAAEPEDPFRDDESARGPAPDMPTDPARASISVKEGRLVLDNVPPPDRDVLEVIFEDMKDAVEDLKDQGNLGNISPLLAKGVDRFFERADVKGFAELDQVRFGVATAALRLQFEPERAHLDEVAQDKIGHIEAVLYQADLITARLPEWVKFLEEEEETKSVFLAQQEDAEAILEHASESLQAAPEQFDVSLFERIREYLDDKTMEGYLAGKDLLISIAHKTFVISLDLLKDTVSATRKLTIGLIASAVVTHLGVVFLNLTGLLPKQLGWLKNWMEYLTTLL